MKIDLIIIGIVFTLLMSLSMNDGDILVGGMSFVALFVVYTSLIPHLRKLLFLERIVGNDD
jgi:hypothetical protein